MTQPSPDATLPCIVCKKTLRSAIPAPHGGDNQPADGLCFNTHGHYGSTAYDPMGRDWLEINVCDQCIVEHRDSVFHCAPGREQPRPPTVRTPWNGEG